MSDALIITLAVIAALLLAITIAGGLVATAIIVLTRYERWQKHRNWHLTEAEAAENLRPHVDRLTIGYYGLPPHNGSVIDPYADQEAKK